MFKKILLPGDLMIERHPSLPVTDYIGKFHLVAKAQQEMNMIRHKKSQMAMPALFFMIDPNGMEYFFG